MAFNSLYFILLFLPLALIFYYITPKKFRNIILLLENLVFYAWGDISYILILLSLIIVNYLFGLLIENSKKSELKKLFVTSAIATDLLVLGYFKYFNFFVENINNYFHSNLDLIHVIMPVGISFYTFMAITYLVDIYRKDVKAEKNPIKVALFLSLFTNILAGPINRYCTFYEQLSKREESIQNFIYGIKRFIIGLSKKVIIANTLATIADGVFDLSANEYSILVCWLGLISYSLQLYFDFSGYSDMAIGIGRMFGFKIMENFNFPYISKTFTEFWRRWHISLSSWFKYYLYIPLGGNRKGNIRTYINLFIVFLVTGFWHGASWLFIFWGLWHGLFMIIERFFNLAKKEFNNKYINGLLHLYCMFFVTIGWVFFRSENLKSAFEYIFTLFDFSTAMVSFVRIGEFINNYSLIILVCALIGMTGLLKNIIEWGNEHWTKQIILNLVLIFLLFFCICTIDASSYSPFIYFQF